MCPRKHGDFAGNRTNVRQSAAVEALLFSQDHFPHLDLFEVVQNLTNDFILFGIFFCKHVFRFFDDGSIGIRTRFFRKNGVDRRFDLCRGKGFRLCQQLRINLIENNRALCFCDFRRKFLLQCTDFLDRIVAKLKRGKHVRFRNFLRLSLHHHDGGFSAGHGNVHVGGFELLKSGIDSELTVDAGDAHFCNRAVKRRIRHHQGSGGGACAKHVRIVLLI